MRRRQLGYTNYALYTSTSISGEAGVAAWLKGVIDKGAAPSQQAILMVARTAGASESDIMRACASVCAQISEFMLPESQRLDPNNAALHDYLDQFRDWCSRRALDKEFKENVTTFRQLGGTQRQQA